MARKIKPTKKFVKNVSKKTVPVVRKVEEKPVVNVIDDYNNKKKFIEHTKVHTINLIDSSFTNLFITISECTGEFNKDLFPISDKNIYAEFEKQVTGKNRQLKLENKNLKMVEIVTKFFKKNETWLTNTNKRVVSYDKKVIFEILHEKTNEMYDKHCSNILFSDYMLYEAIQELTDDENRILQNLIASSFIIDILLDKKDIKKEDTTYFRRVNNSIKKLYKELVKHFENRYEMEQARKERKKDKYKNKTKKVSTRKQKKIAARFAEGM